ncbi:MAG: nuclear transport factor 2 family protein [Saprospiraceae bacterium]|nr:nuclear transport factor 2 family protein [Saprospiraceae bacterium]
MLKNNKIIKNIFISYVEAINNSDLEAAMALISDDVQLINSKYRPEVPAEGIELIRVYISETVINENGKLTIIDLKEYGDVVEAQMEFRNDRIKRLGLERIVGTERFKIKDNKIINFEFNMNLQDPETKVFFDFVRKLEANRPQ